MAKDERLNEEAAMNNNLAPSTYAKALTIQQQTNNSRKIRKERGN